MSLQLLILKERQLDIVDIHFSLEVTYPTITIEIFFFVKEDFILSAKKAIG